VKSIATPTTSLRSTKVRARFPRHSHLFFPVLHVSGAEQAVENVHIAVRGPGAAPTWLSELRWLGGIAAVRARQVTLEQRSRVIRRPSKREMTVEDELGMSLSDATHAASEQAAAARERCTALLPRATRKAAEGAGAGCVDLSASPPKVRGAAAAAAESESAEEWARAVGAARLALACEATVIGFADSFRRQGAEVARHCDVLLLGQDVTVDYEFGGAIHRIPSSAAVASHPERRRPRANRSGFGASSRSGGGCEPRPRRRRSRCARAKRVSVSRSATCCKPNATGACKPRAVLRRR
jgi:hypothetical protein